MRYHCGVDKDVDDLLDSDILKLKVCNGYDDMSKVDYNKLIEDHKDFGFYKKIKHIPKRYQGSFIRWLYRGLSFRQAAIKLNKEMSYPRSRYGYFKMFIKEDS